VPQAVIPLVAAAGVLGAGSAGLLAGLTAIQMLGLNLAIGAAVSLGNQALLNKKAKAPDAGTFRATLRDRSVMVRQPIVSRKLVYGKARVSGPLVYVQSTDNNEYLHLIIPLAGHRVQSIGDVYLDDRISTDTKFTGLVTIEKYLGASDQAASDALIAASDGKWTSSHRLRGIAYLYVKLKWNDAAWPTGIPSIKADIEGVSEAEDPRLGSATAYTRNPALLIRHYLKDGVFGLGCAADEIDDDFFIAAANICDEQVEKAGASPTEFENRYYCDGVIDTASTPQEILQELLTSCGGRLIYAGGKWRLLAAAWTTPTLSFDEGDLAGTISIKTRVSQREAFSAIKGVYVSPQNNWQASDYPAIKSEAQREDLGLTDHRYKDHDLPFTTSPNAAQRLSKIELLKARQPITVETVFKLTGLTFQSGDVIQLSNTRMGWAEKAFEVVEWTLAVQEDEKGNPVLVVPVLLRETVSTIYDWSTDEEQIVDDAPNTDLPDAFNVLAPGAPAVSEELYVTRNGAGVKTRALLASVASLDSFVQDYEFSYKLSSADEWTVKSRVSVPADSVEDITPGIYDFRCRAINTIGTKSGYSTTTGVEIYGLLDPPAVLSGLTVSAMGGLAMLRWSLSADLDVRIGGRIEFRHSSATSSAIWQESVSIGNAVPGSETVALLPLKAGTYLARAYDSSGIPGPVSTAVTKQATALDYASIGLISEAPTFTGTKDGVRVTDAGELTLSSGSDMDSWSSVDGIASWDDGPSVQAAGTYYFAGSFDFGSVQRLRLTASITAQIINVLDLIDSRTSNIDDWQDFDGTDAASADAQVWVRQSDDASSGSPSSPTWADWQRLDSAEFVARSFEFQGRLSSDDPAYNIRVSALTVQAEQIA
jgi:hypothetical protein